MASEKDVYTVKISIDGVESEARKAGDSLDRNIGNAAKKVGGTLNLNLRQTQKISQAIKGNFATLAGLVGFAGISNSLKAGVQDLAAFNLKIAEVNSLFSDNTKVSKTTTDQIKELSIQFGKNKADLASAYYDVISAGSQDAAESVELLTAATKASVVGVTEVETATGAILSVLNSYGKENTTATKAAEQLFAIVQQGRTTFPELAGSIGDVVPLAANLGVSLGELGGFLAVATRTSGNTAKTVTQLAGAFSNILNPSKEAQETIGALNKRLGTNLEFSARALKEKGLVKFFGEIFQASSKFKNQQEILSSLFGSVRALRGVLSVIGGNFGELTNAISAVEKPVGGLDKGFKDISETLSQRFDRSVQTSKSTLDEFLTSIGPSAKSALGIFDQLMINLRDKIVEVRTEAQKGTMQDFMGRGVTGALAGFDPTGGEEMNMLGGVDPLTASMDNLFSQIKGEEGAENPMMQFAVQADSVAESVAKVTEETKKAATEVLNLNNGVSSTPEKFDAATNSFRDAHAKFAKFSGDLARMQKQVFVQGMSRSIQSFVGSMMKGGGGFENFGKQVLGIVGDMAIQIGNFLIAAAIPIEAMIKNIFTAPAAMLAGGIALIALGSLIKGFSGSGGGGGSSAGASVAGSTTDTTEELPDAFSGEEDDVGPESIEKQQMVQLVVHGNIMDSEETGTHLLNILNQEFENKGGRTVYT